MNKLIQITQDNGQLVVTSCQVADDFKKEHKNVLVNIRDILAAENQATKFFHETSYKNRGKQYPMYLMNRDGFSLLVMGFTGAEAMAWKIKYINAFNEMEAQLKEQKKPVSALDALAQTVAALQQQERDMRELKMRTSNVEMTQEEQGKELDVVNSRLDTLNCVGIEGDKQQKLNAQIRLYANKSGLIYAEAWRKFKQCFNTAYRMNISAQKHNMMERMGAKKMTTPEFLMKAGYIDDALRIADKMLSELRRR